MHDSTEHLQSKSIFVTMCMKLDWDGCVERMKICLSQKSTLKPCCELCMSNPERDLQISATRVDMLLRLRPSFFVRLKSRQRLVNSCNESIRDMWSSCGRNHNRHHHLDFWNPNVQKEHLKVVSSKMWETSAISNLIWMCIILAYISPGLAKIDGETTISPHA